eukprot:365028-Chlamydomonas_euryale.AAC.14
MGSAAPPGRPGVCANQADAQQQHYAAATLPQNQVTHTSEAIVSNAKERGYQMPCLPLSTRAQSVDKCWCIQRSAYNRAGRQSQQTTCLAQVIDVALSKAIAAAAPPPAWRHTAERVLLRWTCMSVRAPPRAA